MIGVCVCLGIFGLLATVGNILVTAAIASKVNIQMRAHYPEILQEELRTARNLILLSLAISDLLVGLVSSPLFIAIYIKRGFSLPLNRVYMLFL